MFFPIPNLPIIPLLFIGFSLGSAALLIAGNLLQKQEPLRFASKVAGFFLISALTAIQYLHLGYLLEQSAGVHSLLYLLLLYSIAPCFYFYSRRLLIAEAGYRWRDTLHVLPLLPCLVLPYNLALPLAFLFGSGYLLWLTKTVYFLRQQRQRFHLELLALATLFAIAVAVILLGFIWPLLDEADFIRTYSMLIGLAFFAVTLTLLRFPSITADVSEAVQAAYAETTLKNVDKAAMLSKLTALMQHDKLYTLETLNLPMLAEQLDLSQHQLSELINTEFHQSFSRYIRQQRVDEAKRLLLSDPNASVLSIGLSVGFSTQSNFYAAFRDITGIAPGQYRKNHGSNPNQPAR
ncbi:transcriptional regulator, AraC family [Methylomonas methanica MC09]|uniref:Transcriptional regulator, AraC family n=1 Tax=Methylomonas methanica (strain DSM 25384 / MC09) TaxID=857087 RepID=G0A0E4_METMM|nr:transcriptional regulator, AraC family [Methylomonas methanica MC09]